METWFIYAALSAIFSGGYHFTLKAAAELNHDSSQSTYYSMISAAIISAIFFLLNPDTFNIKFLILLAIINSIAYFISVFTRIDSLKYIQTTIYYPIYKTVMATLIFFIGYFVFGESVTIKQFLGIMLGMITMLLLIQKKENNIQKNLKLGLTFLGFSVLGGIASSIMGKYVAISNINLFLYIFLTCTFTMLHSGVRYKQTKHKKHSNKYLRRIGLAGGPMTLFAYYFFLLALKEGSFVIVYLINSFAIIIVTVLSVIIYKDHMDKRKALALLLTIVSLLLLK